MFVTYYHTMQQRPQQIRHLICHIVANSKDGKELQACGLPLGLVAYTTTPALMTAYETRNTNRYLVLKKREKVYLRVSQVGIVSLKVHFVRKC